METIKISDGSGYGCKGWVDGQVLRHKKHGLITVIKSGSRYFREDGMSFGVGDERGYVYWAECRTSTDLEAIPVLEKEAKAEADRQRIENLKIFCADFVEKADRPGGRDNLPEGETIPIGKGQTIYGGGKWFVIGTELIWYVVNNGADGDDWSYNNVSTGGAGAVGRTLPYSDNLKAEILRLTGYDLEGEKTKAEIERAEKERKEATRKSEWTLEVTIERREKWNRFMVARKKTGKKVCLVKIEAEFGFAMADLQQAVREHNLPSWKA